MFRGLVRNLAQGRTGVLLRALEGTEWRQLLDYASPAFFEVVPLGSLVRQARELAAHASDSRGFASLRSETGRRLDGAGIAVSIEAEPHTSEIRLGELDERTRQALGHRALEIYFAQLFHGETAILDLRASRFTPSGPEHGEAGSAPRWSPRPWWVRWEAPFVSAVRDLYLGFYRDDDERFTRGVTALSLGDAGDLMRAHFGAGDQRQVRFRSRDFHAVFHETFVRCRDRGVSLHRGFLPLGIYLACLYDLLETLDAPFDVRTAFDRAVP